MKVLVTGGAGFVAAHLKTELEGSGHTVELTDVRGAPHLADLTDAAAVADVFGRVRPDACVHLGAISFVPEAARDKNLLYRVNVEGTVHVLEAIRTVVPRARLLFASTAQVMNTPSSAYADMKLAAEKEVARYVAAGLDGVIVRAANHTGPGQLPKFVVASFVKQALDIRRGLADRFVVGNLEAVRDFTDVRDVVRAYRLLLERGEAGRSYTIGSNVRMTMGELLAQIQRLAGVSARVETSPALWRPADASPVLDVSGVEALGWRPEIPLVQTVRDMLACDAAAPAGGCSRGERAS